MKEHSPREINPLTAVRWDGIKRRKEIEAELSSNFIRIGIEWYTSKTALINVWNVATRKLSQESYTSLSEKRPGNILGIYDLGHAGRGAEDFPHFVPIRVLREKFDLQAEHQKAQVPADVLFRDIAQSIIDWNKEKIKEPVWKNDWGYLTKPTDTTHLNPNGLVIPQGIINTARDLRLLANYCEYEGQIAELNLLQGDKNVFWVSDADIVSLASNPNM